MIFPLLLITSFCFAKAKIIITPTPAGDNVKTVYSRGSSSTTATYTITNNTKYARKFTYESIAGMSQTGGTCTNPFTLAANASCTIQFTFTGTSVTGIGIFNGPKICATKSNTDNTSTPFFCSQTTVNNTLKITKLTSKLACWGNNPYGELGSSINSEIST